MQNDGLSVPPASAGTALSSGNTASHNSGTVGMNSTSVQLSTPPASEPPRPSEVVNRLISAADSDTTNLFTQVLSRDARAVMNAIRRLDWRDRVTVAEHLQAVPGAETDLMLRALLSSDRSKHVREAVVGTISRRESDCRMRDLAIALHDRHLDVRAAAGMAFYRLGDARAISPLAESVGAGGRGSTDQAVLALKEIVQARSPVEFILASSVMDPAEKLSAFAMLRHYRRRLRRAGITLNVPSIERLLAEAAKSSALEVRSGADIVTAYLTLPRATDPGTASPPDQLLRAVRRKIRAGDPAESPPDGDDNTPERLPWWSIRRWLPFLPR